MLEVKLIPALTDNYIALLRDEGTGEVAVVDPGESAQVIWCLEKLGWKPPTLILNTHHHADHVAGNEDLQKKYGAALITSEFDSQRIPGNVTRAVKHGETIALGQSTAEVIAIPGHTLGHVAFFFRQAKAVFVGDTLFGLGCGRLFEGTAMQMFTSLQKLAELPEDTQVYCGHEYTEANGKFALHLDPDFEALKKRMSSLRELRSRGLFSVPFTMGNEKKTNPFLRAKDVESFASLRRAKDEWAY